MEVTQELRKLIHRAAPTHELRDVIRKKGVLSLREEGVLLALDGKTCLEEVLAATHSEDTNVDAPTPGAITAVPAEVA
jgi:type II secretory ATPase GspE/PulE/Tfp pilus assembly ATPase PilB-like protein